MYTLKRCVNRKAVTIATKIPTEEMKVILEQIAFKTKDGWEFKLPFDQAFVDKYVDVIFFFFFFLHFLFVYYTYIFFMTWNVFLMFSLSIQISRSCPAQRINE